MLLIILILVLVVGLPGGGYWGYRSGSYRPLGGLMLVLVIVLVVYLIFGGGMGPLRF